MDDLFMDSGFLSDLGLEPESEFDSVQLDTLLEKPKCRLCSEPATYGCVFSNPISCANHRHSWEKPIELLCKHEGCVSEARPSKIGVVFCVKHSKPSDIDRRLYCRYRSCNRIAIHNRSCEFHHTPVEIKTCEFLLCTSLANPGTTRCNTHPIPGKCVEADCKNLAVFGTRSMYRHCYDHKTGGDILINKPICKVESCSRVATHGEWSDPTPSRCFKHQNPEDRDLLLSRCEVPGCFDESTYAFQGKRPYRCRIHALPKMEPIRNQVRNLKRKRD